MTHTAKNSINRKLTLTVALTTGTSLLLACIVFASYDVIALRRAMTREAATLAKVVGINTAIALTFDDAAAATETLGALSAAVPVLVAAVYDRDGNAFARYDSAVSFANAVENEEFILRATESEKWHFHSGYLDLSRSISFKGIRVGGISIRYDTRSLSTRVERYAGIVDEMTEQIRSMGPLHWPQLQGDQGGVVHG